MAPLDPTLHPLLDELANALQTVVLVAEHLERASSATAQDAKSLSVNLRRVTVIVQKMRAGGER